MLLSQNNSKTDSLIAVDDNFDIDEGEIEAFMFMAIGHYTLEGVFLIGSAEDGNEIMIFGKIPKTKKLVQSMVKHKGAKKYRLLETDTIADDVGEYIVHNLRPKNFLVITRDMEDYKIITYEIVK